MKDIKKSRLFHISIESTNHIEIQLPRNGETLPVYLWPSDSYSRERDINNILRGEARNFATDASLTVARWPWGSVWHVWEIYRKDWGMSKDCMIEYWDCFANSQFKLLLFLYQPYWLLWLPYQILWLSFWGEIAIFFILFNIFSAILSHIKYQNIFLKIGIIKKW